MRFRLAAIMIVAGAGCGTKPAPADGGSDGGPDLFVEIKTVEGRPLAQNAMLLVSRSSSMLTNTSTDPPCPSTIGGCGSGAPCPAGCPTRLSEVQAALGDFIDANASDVRFAVAVFPADDLCGATGSSAVLLDFPPASSPDGPDALLQQASKAKAALATIAPGGMAPISGSLEFLDALPGLADPQRDRSLLLVTDVPPNCNGSNVNTCSDLLACRCTVSDCSTQSGLCELGCLDDESAAAAMTRLHSDGIRGAVIAIGPDATAPFSAIALNKLAMAGGFARSCPNGLDSECGDGGACDVSSSLCSRAFLLAGDDAIDGLLERIGGVEQQDPCGQILNHQASDVDHLAVFVNGERESPCALQTGCNTWVLNPSQGYTEVVFLGTTCDALQQATVLTPVTLRFEIAE